MSFPTGAGGFIPILAIVLCCLAGAAEFGVAVADPGDKERVAFEAESVGQSWVTSEGTAVPAQPTPAQLAFLDSIRQQGDIRYALDENVLDGLLAEIVEPESASPWKEWRESLLDWLSGLKGKKQTPVFGFLEKLLSAITPSLETAKWIFYAVLMLTVLSALALVGYELHQSGLFSRLRLFRRPALPFAGPASEEKAGNMRDDSAALPPDRQVAWLLRRSIKVLSDRGEVPDNPALTNGELIRSLQRNGSRHAGAFASIIDLAEPVLYGNEQPSPQSLSQCRRQADRILVS